MANTENKEALSAIPSKINKLHLAWNVEETEQTAEIILLKLFLFLQHSKVTSKIRMSLDMEDGGLGY